MEVIVGPMFGEAAPSSSSSSAYVRERPQEKIPSAFFFLKREDEISGGSQDVSSVSSSSIGSPGDSDDEGEDGVVSSGTSGGFSSLGSLEDSLPIKRGLSNHYAGKSKSFANLLDVSTVKEVQKAENPFNKRRRVLLANKWCRKSSFYSWQNPNSLPLLALDEEDEETTSSSSSSLSNDKVALEVIKPKLQQSKLKVPFNSKSCFHLTDLEVQVEHQIQ